MSAATMVLNVGAVGPAEDGPDKKVFAACAISDGANVPLLVIGEPEIVLLNIIPSPVIATLVTVPAPAGEAHTPSPLRYVPDEGAPDAASPAICIIGAVVESPKGIPITSPPYLFGNQLYVLHALRSRV